MMEIKIETWEMKHKAVCITEDGLNILTVTKRTTGYVGWAALIKLPSTCLDIAEARVVAKALELAAKVAGYLDDLEPDEAMDAIKGMPTTPYDGWRPMPRAGRTENP